MKLTENQIHIDDILCEKNSEYRDHLETCVILECVIWWCVITVGVDVMGQSNLALVICHSVRLSKAVQ